MRGVSGAYFKVIDIVGIRAPLEQTRYLIAMENFSMRIWLRSFLGFATLLPVGCSVPGVADCPGWTELHVAAAEGDLPRISQLLAKGTIPIDSCNANLRTALYE